MAIPFPAAAGAMTGAPRTRILIVDDSAVMRSLLRSVVSTDPSLEVAATAADGRAALGALVTANPDLVLLDVEMPVMDGLETLKQMRQRAPRLPIVMCSALTQRGAQVTIEALASGASDYVAKPAGQENREAATRALAAELIPKIHALTHALALRRAAAAASLLPASHRSSLFPAPPLQPRPQRIHAAGPPAVVAIGVSTGGPAALDVLLPALPASFPLPVLIVQHMPELFTRQLAERLDTRCALRVREAEEGMAIRAGEIYIARGNWHMRLRAAAGRSQSHRDRPALDLDFTLHLDQAPQENHCRPAVDCLLRSVANVFGGRTLAVILTGMGHDGLAGCRALHELGATILAQDEATSAVWGMPGSVVQEGLARSILPLREIAPELVRLTAKSSAVAAMPREMAG